MSKQIDLYIIDDGTLDTVVYDSVSKKKIRFDTEFRLSFKNDNDFLKEIEKDLYNFLN